MPIGKHLPGQKQKLKNKKKEIQENEKVKQKMEEIVGNNPGNNGSHAAGIIPSLSPGADR